MTVEVCPYCRAVIEPDDGNALLCNGCGTPHHADCYAENGGCTVFGCSAGPADEQKVTLTGKDLSGATAAATFGSVPGMLPGVGLMPRGWKPEAPPAPPPPLPAGMSAAAPPAPPTPYVPRFGSGSVLFGSQPVAAAPVHSVMDFDIVPNPEAKNRMTFIVLGVLLGAVGGHNFYAGYYGKATTQLCISVLTFGLASPMSWIWAVIDISTVDRDHRGIKFKS